MLNLLLQRPAPKIDQLGIRVITAQAYENILQSWLTVPNLAADAREFLNDELHRVNKILSTLKSREVA